MEYELLPDYEFYTSVLNRSVIPNEEEFNKFVDENTYTIVELVELGLIEQRQANGYKKTICMFTECDYLADLTKQGKNDVKTSESIGGYSYTSSSKNSDLLLDLDIKSTSSKKFKWLKHYCYIFNGL